MAKKKNTLFVIFASPQNFGGPNRYFAKDGSVTNISSLAAKFWTWSDAKTFAEEKGIELNKLHQIGQEDFTDFDLRNQ
nr:hypothetical protein [Nitrosomonas nitrosa]